MSCDSMFLIIREDMEATPHVCPESNRGLGNPPLGPEKVQQALRRERQKYCRSSHLVHSLYPHIV